MTDKEVIKALECHAEESLDTCSLCPLLNIEGCAYEAAEYALDLINRQQAEIEKLKKILAEEEEKYKLCAKRFYKLGVKELAKRLKDYYINHKQYKRHYAHTLIDFLFDVTDNLVAELVGDTE